METKHNLELNDISYIKLVTIGSVNPQNPLSDESKQKQLDFLNRCLETSPKGKIIAFDRTVGRFMIGQHEMIMEKVTYHIGFKRKPYWLMDE